MQFSSIAALLALLAMIATGCWASAGAQSMGRLTRLLRFVDMQACLHTESDEVTIVKQMHPCTRHSKVPCVLIKLQSLEAAALLRFMHFDDAHIKRASPCVSV